MEKIQVQMVIVPQKAQLFNVNKSPHPQSLL